MLIALATCEDLPEWEVDDRPLHEAFAALGVDVARPVWNDATVDWSAFDACLIRTTWDYQEHRSEFLQWAKRVDGSTRLFNPYPIIEWNTHKRYLLELANEGMPIAPTELLERGSSVDVRSFVAERGWNRAFLKPAVGATAWETLRFDASDEGLGLAQAHLDRMLVRDDMLMQPYLARVETEGELSVIFIDAAFSHAVRKVPVSGDYRTQNDFGAHDEPVQLSAEELALAERVYGQVDADLLYGRVDFLRDDGGALVVTELELVEPSLFFRHDHAAADRLARALCSRLECTERRPIHILRNRPPAAEA